MSHPERPRAYVLPFTLPNSTDSQNAELPSNYRYEYNFMLVSNFTASKLTLRASDQKTGYAIPPYSQRAIAIPASFREGFVIQQLTANTDAVNTQLELTFTKFPYGDTVTLSGF